MYTKKLLFPVLVVYAAGIISCAHLHNQTATVEESSVEILPKDAARSYLECILGYESEIDGNWEDALSHYKAALKTDPSSIYLKTQISSMMVKLGRYDEATALLEEVVKTNPEYVPAL